MKTCFAFPGQGSQHVGMGKDLYDAFNEVKRVYDEASGVLGYDVAALSFNGPQEELNLTYRTQPCLLVASVAAHTALTLRNRIPSVVVGHSLGEYSALVAAGSMAFKDAVRVTEMRGRIMQEAVPEGQGLMAAILGLDRKVVDELCGGVAAGYVAAANYNSPGQVVISGEKAAVEEAMKKARDRGAKRAIPLQVSVPSHCRLMQEAGRTFEEALKAFEIKDARLPFVCNVEARFIAGAQEIRAALVRQLSESVLWEDCVKAIAAWDVAAFVEVGPGKVLSGLIKRIVPYARTFSVEDSATLNRVAEEGGHENGN